MALLTLR